MQCVTEVTRRDEGMALLQTLPPKYSNNPIQFLLDTNMKSYGKGILPSDLKTATLTLNGEYILQV